MSRAAKIRSSRQDERREIGPETLKLRFVMRIQRRKEVHITRREKRDNGRVCANFYFLFYQRGEEENEGNVAHALYIHYTKNIRIQVKIIAR